MKLITVKPIMLRRNYALHEFVCKDESGEVYVSPLLSSALQLLHNTIREWNSMFAFVITSGYRNKTHNAKVGGAVDSYHMYGMAVDTASLNDIPELLFVMYMHMCGFHGYFTYVALETGEVLWRHMDVRDVTDGDSYAIIKVNKEVGYEQMGTIF